MNVYMYVHVHVLLGNSALQRQCFTYEVHKYGLIQYKDTVLWVEEIPMCR